MKLQFPLSASVLIASFGAVGCQVSDAELPSTWVDPTSDGAEAGAGETANAGAAGTTSPGTGGSGGEHAADDPNAYFGAAGSAASTGGAGGAAANTSTGSGSGGAGGTGGAESTSMGAGGGGGTTTETPDAGSGGSAGTNTAGAGGGDSVDMCPSDYTIATHIVINVSWASTYALAEGSGQVHVWTKSHFLEDGSVASVESQTCGSKLPPIKTTALAGNENILPEIPDATWDDPHMPRFMGTATRNGDDILIDPGVALVGLTMANPKGAWPDAYGSIMGFDHDGDGKLGLTAIAKQDGGFSAPPTNLLKSSRADKLYLATRNIMTLSATVPGCPASYTGTADVTNFENHIIGCHVKGGSECNATQVGFVDDNRTQYQLGSATFTSVVVDAEATCADVRAAVPD